MNKDINLYIKKVYENTVDLNEINVVDLKCFEFSFQREVNTFINDNKIDLSKYGKYIYNKINSLDFKEDQKEFILDTFSDFYNFYDYVRFPNGDDLRLNKLDLNYHFNLS